MTEQRAAFERADFEAFVAEWTGRSMGYHEQAGTWGLGPDSFAWACWQKAVAAERERCRGACCGIEAVERYCGHVLRHGTVSEQEVARTVLGLIGDQK